MNTKPHKAQVTSTATDLSTIHTLRLAVMMAVLASFSLAQAAVFVKTNNVTALNLAGSWTNNAVPGAADIARWDNTVSDVNNTTNTLGASLSLDGVKILNPVAPIVIVTNAGGNVLTVGASGIDMSAATADLTFSNNVALLGGVAQTWTVGSGRSLLLDGAGYTRNTRAMLNVDTSAGGIVSILAGTASTVLNYSTLNQTDFGALDASKNFVGANSVITYTANPAGTANNASLSGTVSWIDVTTSNPAGGPSAFRLSNTLNVSGVRFNMPNANGIDWVVDANSRNLNISSACFLITPNAGSKNVQLNTGSGNLRLGTGSEVMFAQHNTNGDLVINGQITQAGAGSYVTKTGAGRMILNNAFNNYSGGTYVEQGTVLVNSPGSIAAGSATVNSGASLGGNGVAAAVTVASGGKLLPGNVGVGAFLVNGTLTLNAGTYIDFYSPSVPTTNTTALLMVTNNSLLTVNGTVNVDILSGKPAIGQYPLIKWTNSIPAPTFANFALASLPLHTMGYLSNNATAFTVDLVITNIAEPLSWATGSGTWNTNGGSIWKDPQGNTTTYQEANGVGDSVLFEDALSGGSPITVTLNTTLVPGFTTVSNSTKTYTISGSGSIAGAGGLTKAGSGTLTLGTANAFTGTLNLNAGTVSFSALNNLGAGAITFGGGTLQYNGNSDDISVRTVTLGAGGGTINDGGNTITFANPIGNNGAGGLTKAGSGILTLTGTNKYSGNTVVANGTLALAGNTYISNSAAIIVNSGKVLDAATSGVGLSLVGSTAQILAGAGTVNGTVISSNGVITPGTNGVVGTLTFGNDLTVAGGTVVIDLATNTAQRDLISVGGSLALYGGTLQLNVTGTLTNGVYKLIQYAGGLNSGSGSAANLILSGYTQAGKILALSDTIKPNEIDLVVSTQGGASTIWQGNYGGAWDIETTPNFTNSSGTEVNFVQGDKPTFNDAGLTTSVNLAGALQPGSVTVTANVNNYSFNDGVGGGVGKLTGSGGIIKNGSSTLTIATANLNSGPTVINGGTVQVGAGGTLGDLGSGNITNNAALVFNQSDSHTQPGPISGTGSLTQQGGGTLTLAANNTYSGPTTIASSGALQVGNGGAAGSLGSGAVTNDGTLIYNHTGSFGVGNIKAGPANAGAVTFAGAATVTLNNGNTYINNTTINNGMVKLAVAEAIPSAATVPGSTGWLVLDGGAAAAGVLDLNGFNQTVNALSGVNGTVNGMITNSSLTAITNVLTVGTSAGVTNTYYGSIVDNASGSKTRLIVAGAGGFRPNGLSAYTGGTFVGDTATLVFANGANFVAGSQITLSNGTTFFLQFNGGGANTSVPLVIPDGAAATVSSTALGNGYSGLVTGGTTATNVILGPVSYSAGSNTKQLQSMLGTVLIPSGQELRFSSTSGVNNGGDNTTFEVNGFLHLRNAGAASLGALTGTGTINNMTDGPSTGTDTFTIGAKGVNATFSGTISDDAVNNKVNALIKTGSGTQTLDGTLSYAGATTVNGGTLAIASGSNPSTSLDTVANITIQSNAVISVAARSDSALNLGNSIGQSLTANGTIMGNLNASPSVASTITPGTAGTAGTLAVSGSATLNNGTTNVLDFASTTTVGGGVNDLISVTNNLTLNGVVVIRPNFLSGGVALGQPYTIIKYGGTLTGDTNNLALDTASYSHLSAVFSTSTPGAVTLTFLGASNLVWVGDSTNSWQVGVVTNWFDGVSSNYFGQYDTVKFNDSASNFTAVLTGTLMPNGVTVDSGSNYVFSGSGKLSGPTSLVKAGTGTLTLTNSTANDFSGVTVVSNGVIYLRAANMLSPNSSLEIKSAGMVKINGWSPSIGGLSGSGAIDNNGAAASVLTVGSLGNGVWSGTISNSGAGGVSLVVNDTNNLVISGTNLLNSATASRVNNGSSALLIVTNTGVITGAGELWIGCESAVTGKVVVAGGSITVSNWLVIGRNNTNANGTLIVNSGTVQKAGAGTVNLVVGSLGATGNLTVNGGQVLNNGMLWVGEAPGAKAVVNLNGGLLQATQVRTNFNGGAPDSSVVNFNGGTLQASAASANFIAVYAANIQNGGLILDDGGFALNLTQPLLAAGTGGLSKQGTGTVYLDAANTYTGTTAVSAGKLAGVGIIAGPVTVAASGTLGAGDAGLTVGKLTVNNTLNITGGAALRISKTGGVKTNDQVVGISAVTYGSTLTISNVTSDLTALAPGDTFTLFSATTHNNTGFTSIVGSPGSGMGYTFTNGVLSVIATMATNPTNISFTVSGNTLSLSWPADHTGWTLQAQTNNLSTGLGTNWVDVAGSTSVNSMNVTIDPSKPTVFYRLKN